MDAESHCTGKLLYYYATKIVGEGPAFGRVIRAISLQGTDRHPLQKQGGGEGRGLGYHLDYSPNFSP